VGDRVLGVIPPIGGGLRDLAETGQVNRLLDYYFPAYLEVFDRIIFFSYFQERLEDYTDSQTLRTRVRIHAPRKGWPPLLYAVGLPLLAREAIRTCNILRVFQATGALPAVLSRRIYHIPYVTTYGYDYLAAGRSARATLMKLAGIRLLEWLGVRAAEGIIVTTPALAQHLARWVPPQKVHLVPNGVDTTRFVPGKGDLPGENRVPRLLFVGRLARQKNLTILLAALERLMTDCQVNLTVIGAGPEEQKLRAVVAARHLPVEFTGVVRHEDLPKFFAHADVFVLPSQWEGHPKALLEAMSAGLACVVSDVEGNRSLITDRVTGLLVEPGNPTALESAIRLVLNDSSLRQRLGQAARMQVLKQYDLHLLLRREVAVIQKTMLRGQWSASSKPTGKELTG